MDIARIGTALRRRWYVVAVGTVLALVVGFLAYSTSSTSYVSQAKVSLIPPNFSTVENPTNPLLQLNSAIGQTAAVLVDALSAEDVAARIADAQGGTYELSNVELRSEVFTGTISITATGPSADSAAGTAQAVVDEIGAQLDDLQARAGVVFSSARIVADVSIPPTSPTASSAGGVRAAGGAAVGVVLLSLLVALAVDSLRGRRPRGGARGDDAAPSPEAPGRTGATSSDAAGAGSTAGSKAGDTPGSKGKGRSTRPAAGSGATGAAGRARDARRDTLRSG